MQDDNFGEQIIDRKMRMLGHTILSANISTHTLFAVFMPPTLKKLKGHIALAFSVCECDRVLVQKKK